MTSDEYTLTRWRWLDYVAEQSNNLKAVFPYLATARYVSGEGPDGVPQAFVVGSAPGAIEQTALRPFKGSEGIMVRQLMRIAGLEPAESWLTYAIKYKLPANRLPRKEEVKAFRPLLQREWLGVGRPKLIITIGSTAAMMVLLRGDLPKAGIPQTRKDGVVIYPMSSPRIGLLGDDTSKEMIENQWEKLGEWRRNNVDSS